MQQKLLMRHGTQPVTPVQSKSINVSPDINVYTCVIGKKATQAKYYVSEPSSVVRILEQMSDAV